MSLTRNIKYRQTGSVKESSVINNFLREDGEQMQITIEMAMVRIQANLITFQESLNTTMKADSKMLGLTCYNYLYKLIPKFE